MGDDLVNVDGAVALGQAVAGVKIGAAPGNDLSQFDNKIKTLKSWFILYLQNNLKNLVEQSSFLC